MEALFRVNGVLSFENLYKVDRPVIIAHRGASQVERENTLEAFRAAIDMGADAIEFDVRRTRDNVLVIHHDACIASGTAPINDLTYPEAVDLAKASNFHLPTLDETLKLCQDKVALDIELKENGYESDVIPLVGQYYDLDHVVFTSFYDDCVARLKEIAPQIMAGLILGVDPPATLRTRLSELLPLKRLKNCRADFVAPNYRLLKPGLIRRMRAAGYPVWVWTVNDVSLADRLSKSKVAAIITDTPDIIKRIAG
ncbi:MAG: glycerophosphodiester phosphodiesterase [Candidatus Zixiibacteriota bacterium]|nr:MAG: glycerophosphodiester phosphodiesterase [candidate division Zixibacteria bacterium]